MRDSEHRTGEERAASAASSSMLTPGEWRVVAVALAVAVLLVVAAVVASAVSGVAFETFTRDPTTLADMRSYTGALSNLGAALWVAAGTVAVFAGGVLWRLRHARRSRLLLSLGSLTIVLAADDLFLIHESIAPFFGVHQRVVVGAYVVGLGWVLWRHMSTILASPAWLLALSCALFAVSLAFDQFSSVDRYVIEDGCKLVGIVGWLLYLTVISSRWLVESAQVRSLRHRAEAIRR